MAVTSADPNATPVTWAGVEGVVAPGAMKTLGETPNMDGSLLASATVTPSVGAGVLNVTLNAVDWPGATERPVGRAIPPKFTTRMAAVPLTYPPAAAVTVAAPRVPPITLNVPVVPPAGIATFAVSKVTLPAGLEERAMEAPVSAGSLSVIVPLMLCVNPAAVELNVTVIVGVATVTAVVPGWYPGAVARMFVLPLDSGVTITVATVPFCGTVTVAGTEMTLGSKPLRVTTTPPVPAAVLSVTASVLAELCKFKGFGVSVTFCVLAVIVTVEGLLFVNPSLTISWAT